MKKLLMIAGLLITLSNVGASVSYAICRCYQWDELVCEGKYCWMDMDGCFCTDEEIE